MARICTSPYPIEKVGDSPYQYSYPVNAGIPRQHEDEFGQYPRRQVYLSSLGTSIYLLPSGDEDETKIWYPLSLGMDIEINFFFGDWYETKKPVPTLSRRLRFEDCNWIIIIKFLKCKLKYLKKNQST